VNDYQMLILDLRDVFCGRRLPDSFGTRVTLSSDHRGVRDVFNDEAFSI